MAEGYKGHKVGSRKGEVHKAFDEGGLLKATQTAADLKLSPQTVKSWVVGWGRGGNPEFWKLPTLAERWEFDLPAWREKVMKTVEYFSVLPRPGVKGTQHTTLKEAIKQAKKIKVDVIWAVNKAGRFAPLNPDDWKRWA